MTEKTRKEHVEWCKQRAREYLNNGDAEQAILSMASDFEKHPETSNHAKLAGQLALAALFEGTIELESSALSNSNSEDESIFEIGKQDYYTERDFADQQGGAKKSTEDAMNNALEDPGNSQDDERDDLDGELKWLEELAASQNASDDAFLGAGTNLDSLGALPDEDFIPDWLNQIIRR